MSKELQDLKILGIANRLAWLQNNFYQYVIKAVDPFNFNVLTGAQPIPGSEITKRQQAQDEIDEIEAAETYEEVDHLTIEFNP